MCCGDCALAPQAHPAARCAACTTSLLEQLLTVGPPGQGAFGINSQRSEQQRLLYMWTRVPVL